MQLRVARLCLDCEELFVGDKCPVCASDRFAFLTTWLPVEERRKWRRPAPKPLDSEQGLLPSVKRMFSKWMGEEVPEPEERRIRTRATDVLPKLDFDDGEKAPEPKPAAARELVRDDGKA
jgi:hypothetical protein